jgi:hypothetical protein
MPSASGAAHARGGTGEPLLKGTDLGKNAVTVLCCEVRESPEGWGSALIMDFDPAIAGRTSVALNKTNIKALVEMIDDDYETWAGYDLTFERVRVNNPQTKQPTWGISITEAKKSKRKIPKRDDEVPF